MALAATVLHVDLSRQSVETRTVPEETYRKYPGDSALAAYLLLQTIPAGADPLGPDSVLVMADTVELVRYGTGWDVSIEE